MPNIGEVELRIAMIEAGRCIAAKPNSENGSAELIVPTAR